MIEPKLLCLVRMELLFYEYKFWNLSEHIHILFKDEKMTDKMRLMLFTCHFWFKSYLTEFKQYYILKTLFDNDWKFFFNIHTSSAWETQWSLYTLMILHTFRLFFYLNIRTTVSSWIILLISYYWMQQMKIRMLLEIRSNTQLKDKCNVCKII